MLSNVEKGAGKKTSSCRSARDHDCHFEEERRAHL